MQQSGARRRLCALIVNAVERDHGRIKKEPALVDAAEVARRSFSTASAQKVKVFARGDAAATSPLSTAAAPLKQSWSSGFRLLVADGPILNTLDQDGVWSVPPTATVSRAVIDMVKYRSGSVIVADQSGMCGIVTERDILDKMPFTVGKSREMTVAQLMSWCERHRATSGRTFRTDAATTDQSEGANLSFGVVFRKLFQAAVVR